MGQNPQDRSGAGGEGVSVQHHCLACQGSCAKLAATEADVKMQLEVMAKRAAEHDAALARVNELEDHLASGLRGTHVCNEARIAALEEALGESADALEELEGHYCYRMIDMTKDGVTGPGKCDYCDVADAAVAHARRVLEGKA